MLITFQKRLVEIVLLWALIGYPLLGMYTTITGIDNRIASVTARIVVALICLFLITTSLSDGKFKIAKLLFFFLFLYLSRLIYDYAYQYNDYALVAIQVYASSVLIPAIAVGSYSEYLLSIQKRIVMMISFSGAIFLPAFFYAYRTGLFYTQGTDDTNVRYASEFVNAVSLGHFTCTVAIAAFFYVIEYRPRLIELLAHATIVVGSVAALFLSGSRAAFIGLVVASAIYAISRPSRLLVLIPFLLSGLMYLPQDNFLVQRMSDLVIAKWDTGALARLDVQSTAIADFLDSPIIGKHFIDMNLGLIGAIPLYALIGVSMYRALRFRTHLTFYAIIYFVSFAFLQTSGAIWAADSLFVLTSIFLTASKKFDPRFLTLPTGRSRTMQRSLHAGA